MLILDIGRESNLQTWTIAFSKRKLFFIDARREIVWGQSNMLCLVYTFDFLSLCIIYVIFGISGTMIVVIMEPGMNRLKFHDAIMHKRH